MRLTDPLAFGRRLVPTALALVGVTARAAAEEIPRTTLLVRTQVAGTRYHRAVEALPELVAPLPLFLVREPTNPHDDLAIEVRDPQFRKLGYVPRIDNQAVARLMDSGHTVSAELTSIDPTGWMGFPALGLDLFLIERARSL